MGQATFQTSQAIEDARAQIAYFGRMLFQRFLTDAAGGNISHRIGDVVVMSATLSGQKRQWQIEAEDVLVVDMDGKILLGDSAISREARVHLSLHREFGEYGTGIIHAHPHNLMVFATLAKELPPIMEATRKFGVTPVAKYAPSHTRGLAKHITETFYGREQLITSHAAATIAPWHGLFVMAKDLDAAFDAVERLDNNAYCMMMGRSLVNAEEQEAMRQQMENVISNYQED